MSGANWSNFTDFTQLPQKANEASSSSFWAGMLMMVWVVLFLLLIGFGFEVALMVSSFIALIIAILLAYAELVAWSYIAMFAAIIVFEFLYVMFLQKKQNQ